LTRMIRPSPSARSQSRAAMISFAVSRCRGTSSSPVSEFEFREFECDRDPRLSTGFPQGVGCLAPRRNRQSAGACTRAHPIGDRPICAKCSCKRRRSSPLTGSGIRPRNFASRRTARMCAVRVDLRKEFFKRSR
jgi:hypothetical protein